MVKKFTPPIDYTARDFDSIKSSLIEYAKRYYPNTATDFNDASFGALMIDMVSYVGDVLSFYLDYQASESFLDSAIELKNVIRLAKQLGYKYDGEVTAYGIVSLYLQVPANVSGLGPDTRYLPVLREGTRLSSTSRVPFILTQDVDFNSGDAQVLVAQVDEETGNPLSYGVKMYGEAISGDIGTYTFPLGEDVSFPKVFLDTPAVAEILSVFDAEGHEYYEVEYLSQDIIYKSLPNRGNDKDIVSSILKTVSVPRRFVLDKTPEGSFLQFGGGSTSDAIIENDETLNPSNVALKMHGKKYISATSFDPSKLTKNNSLGVAPSNTTITVTYRSNLSGLVNLGVGELSSVDVTLMSFEEENSLTPGIMTTVRNSLEVTNEEPIVGDIQFPTVDEIRIRAQNAYSTQNRAVTVDDYKSLVYNMPAKFGKIRKCKIMQDKDSFKPNMNLYTIGAGLDNTLQPLNNKIKVNLKNWLSNYKMINDTLDILDANIVNLGIKYKVIGETNINKFDLMQDISVALENHFSKIPEIGEPFYITDVYNVINVLDNVVDTVDVDIFIQNGALYSDYSINLTEALSPDGRFIKIPQDAIYEIKFIEDDIQGKIV
tara:strand:+ start:123 stop:1925 length:1803 start_codon:yes stop_codon:yes gene_type:complete